MRRAFVLIHLLLFGMVPFADATTEGDAIFESPHGRACFVELLRQSAWGLGGPFEHAAFIIEQSDGSFTCEAWPQLHRYLSESFRGPIPAHAVAVVHTHPVEYPQPSFQDQKEASRIGLPIYVITIRGVYKALPGTYRVAALAGGQWFRQVPPMPITASP